MEFFSIIQMAEERVDVYHKILQDRPECEERMEVYYEILQDRPKGGRKGQSLLRNHSELPEGRIKVF